MFQSRAPAFAAMDEMMNRSMPFPDAFGQMGPFGGGHAGDTLFRQMDDIMATVKAGGSLPGGGSYSSKTMMYSSKRGSDGNVHSERFTSSTVGVPQRSIRETQQAYSNSATGIDKMALERQLGEQGRKVVKERSRRSGEERDTQMFRGMTEEHAPRFEERWHTEAAPYIPSHNMNRSKPLTSGGLGAQSLDHRPACRGGYPSRASDTCSTASSYAPSEVGDMPRRGALGPESRGSAGSRQNHVRPSSDSSQVGSLLRHEDMRSNASQHRSRRRDNPFEY